MTAPHRGSPQHAGDAALDDRFTPSAAEVRQLETFFPLLAQLSDPWLRERTAGVWAYALRQSTWVGLDSVPFLKNLADWRLVDHVNAVAATCLATARTLQATLGLELDLDR